MLKLIAISALLCAHLLDASADRTAAIAQEVRLQHQQSYSVAIGPHIFTTAKNQTHLFVNSTAPNFQPCAIAFEEYSIQTKIQATTIGRKILVWGVRSKYVTSIGDRIEHTVLIVDPWRCTFKAASTFEEERPPGDFEDEDHARVVVHGDSFDVFYPSLKTCAPCRYSIEGKRIDLQYQLEINRTMPMEIESDTFFRIQTFCRPTPGDGYVRGYIYAHNFGSGTSSVIKILDENFRVVKQRFIDHKVDMIAANPYGPSNVHLCYKTQFMIFCESFDADLELSFTIRLPVLKGYTPDAFWMDVDAWNNLIVSVVQTWRQEPYERKVGYFLVGKNGSFLDAATVHQESKNVGSASIVRGFFADSKYCIENVEVYPVLGEGHDFVKCVI